MPIYEYRCGKCGKKSEVITFRVSEEVSTACSHCGSESTHRVPSRVRVRLSEETRMERLADPSRLAGLDENDPAGMARFMKEMGREMDGEMDGVDIDAMVDEAMSEGGGAEGSDYGACSDLNDE